MCTKFGKNVDSVHKMLYVTLISKQRCTLKTNTPVVGLLTGEVVGEENEKGRCDIFLEIRVRGFYHWKQLYIWRYLTSKSMRSNRFEAFD